MINLLLHNGETRTFNNINACFAALKRLDITALKGFSGDDPDIWKLAEYAGDKAMGVDSDIKVTTLISRGISLMEHLYESREVELSQLGPDEASAIQDKENRGLLTRGSIID